MSFGDGTYPEAVYLPFADIEEVTELKDYRFPSADWYDYSGIKIECENYEDYVICIEGAGTPDFINGIARCRGVEQVLLDIGTENPVFLELMERRFEFFYNKIEKTLKEAEGMVDVVCFGDDLGEQNGLLLSPDKFDRLFAPYYQKLFNLAHKYNTKTMMHCCGSCFDLIPRLIDLGLDILEVVQVDAAKMDIRRLHENFYKKILFCGSISVQHTLPHGSKND
ncbi:MAG: uroporphyrinogen decarboxylase family protein, partial [bacterium]